MSSPPDHALASAEDAESAGGAVVDHLAALGLMPSFYLDQGGRLRCQAVRGYWQIFDGMPYDAGVIGRTFSTGEPIVTVDLGEEAAYLEAAAGVVAEACFPVRVGERVVGVLNVESTRPFADGVVEEVAACAQRLGARLARLGPLDVPSPAQALARIGVRLAALSDPQAIVAETLRAAQELSGFSSSLLSSADPPLHRAEGPLAVVLGALSSGDLAAMGAWVDGGTSSYTIDDPAAAGFAGHEALRRGGAAAMAVLPLAAAGMRFGVLVLADAEPHRLATDEVELLELLAMQAASALGTALAVRELRHRAARDPLTGLGHHASFHAALAGSLDPAVVVVDVDHFKEINDRGGHASGDDVLRAVAELLSDAAPGAAYRVGGDEFAILAEGSDDDGVLRLGHRIVEAARLRGVTVSAGAAAAAAGERGTDLLARADAALYAAKGAGRDGVALG